MDEKLFSKLVKPRTKTPNVMCIHAQPFDDGKKSWQTADQVLRSHAQNIISHIDAHSHLRKAQVLLLVKTADSDAKKLDKGERITAGKAAKANPRDKLLSGIAKNGEQADFVVWLSGAWLRRIDEHYDEQEALHKKLALIDHELTHCSAKVAGEFVELKDLDNFIEGLGKRYIETRKDVTKDDGEVLVRYYVLNKDSKFTWKMRKHDIEEFNGIVRRHGAWDIQLSNLVDVVVENKDSLFDTAKAEAA